MNSRELREIHSHEGIADLGRAEEYDSGRVKKNIPENLNLFFIRAVFISEKN